MSDFEIVVLPHTHWDREWYLPFEEYRLRLVTAVDELLDILDQDAAFEHFLLDGQTVAVEDVIALRPDFESRIREYVTAGRLAIGPWYVLQDEFLVGGESVVRNLIEGRRVAESFGHAMQVGYLPDAFGHIAQMPRILRGFGLDATLLWRGVGDRSPGLEWSWRAPSGHEVTCLWLPFGYGIGANLPPDAKAAAERVRFEMDRHQTLSQSGLMVLMAGCDHAAPQRDLPEILTRVRSEIPEVEITHAGLEYAVSRLRERMIGQTLPVVEGELRRPGGGGNVLPGVLSARSWQKRDHDQAEWLLSRVSDPLTALAEVSCDAERRHAWRLLLRCQPHDSICGCSADVVHREIDVRLGRSVQVASGLARRAIQVLSNDTLPSDPVHQSLAIWNPHAASYSGPVELHLEVVEDDLPFRLVGERGELPYEIVSERPSLQQTERPPAPVQPLRTRSMRVRALASEVPALGLQVLRIETGPASHRASEVIADAESISNEHLRLEACEGGFCIVDLASGDRFVHDFVDEPDRGDTYNFCPVDAEAPVDSACVHFDVTTKTSPVGGTLSLRARWARPANLSEDRSQREGEGLIGIVMHARLIGNSRSVECNIELDNQSCDHRLRARLRSGRAVETFVTDTPFAWVERSTAPAEPAVGEEDVTPNHPISTMAYWRVGDHRVGVTSVGLRDVELSPDGDFYLTFLRSVGWLSRPDLSTRRSPAGPPIYTPEAQGIGQHAHRYVIALQPISDEVPNSEYELIRTLDHLRILPHALGLGRAEPSSVGFLSLVGPGVRLSAVKRSEDGQHLIVRLQGARDQSLQARLVFESAIQAAWLSELDERVGEPLEVDGNREFSITVPAQDVVTVAVALAPN